MQKYLLLLCCCLVLACASDKATDNTTTNTDTSVTKTEKKPANEKMATTTEQERIKAEMAKRRSRKKQIVFFGNSLAAGYKLDNPQKGFVGLIADRMIGAGITYQLVNAGLSGETTAGGLERIDWYLRTPISILVIELGGNDGLRGINPANTKQNLQGIIDKVLAKDPTTKIVLAGMEAPPNMGEKFTANFRKLYKELADENKIRLIPFLLDGVAGDPSLNLPDGIHPNEEGHRIVANNVWHYIQNLF